MALRSLGQVRTELTQFGRSRFLSLMRVGGQGEPDFISGVLLTAIGIRETNLENIAGDFGHGRGVFQIDDRFHQAFLRSIPACRSGSYRVSFSTREGGALPRGRVPGLTRGARYAIALLRANYEFARRNGVKRRHRKRFAIAAYNCGAGNALRSYREGGIRNIDARTAGRNYSKDVLQIKAQVSTATRGLGWR